MAAVPAIDLCRRGWSRMAPLMPSLPGNSPVKKEPFEVFHIERLQAE
jgi:L-rhamnose mutarotase